ncbi:MAG: hypothetical protein HQL69_21245 [Magnetococcales bacterium]|nr:hypothetical protein [Magnetococcales bacterium]
MPSELTNSLSSLKKNLESSFSSGPRQRDAWSEPSETAKFIKLVKSRHDNPGVEANPKTVAMAVEYFRRHGQPNGWRGLKHTCFGAGSIDEKGWCLLSDKILRNRLFSIAQREREPRRQQKCLQGLLSCYWRFPLATAKPDAKEGWKELRTWLEMRLQVLENMSSRKPGWLLMLTNHRNLLQDNPCNRYGPQLFSGDGSEFQQAIEGLSIPSDSWVKDEAVFAQINVGTSFNNDRFIKTLPDLLSIAMGRAGIDLSKSLKLRCIALLVSRYALCKNRPEHIALRDAALSAIGNPWLRRASWDASVTDAQGNPDENAREMVNGWLKRRLITDFFELLSADGIGDTRRLDYWIRFEPCIEDMWFGLGSSSRNQRGENISEFRQRARGRLFDLDQTTANNNAFIMKIGEYLAVEFGASGNAFFIFKWENLPTTLSQQLLHGPEKGYIPIHSLRSTNRVDRLIHRDSDGAGLTWEQKFDDKICPIIGYWPEKQPRMLNDNFRQVTRIKKHTNKTYDNEEYRRKKQHTENSPNRSAERNNEKSTSYLSPYSLARTASKSTSSSKPHSPKYADNTTRTQTQPNTDTVPDDVEVIIESRNLKYADKRSAGGAFWILTGNSDKSVSIALRDLGFGYRPGKGWWRE